MRRDAWCSPTMRRAFTLAALLFGTCRHEASAGTLQRYEYVFPDQSIYVYDEDDGFRLVDKVDLPGVIPGLESSDLWPHRSKPTRGDQGRGTAPVKTSQGWYQTLPQSDAVLAGLFDMRLPLTFSLEDCTHIGEIIVACVPTQIRAGAT